MISKQVVGGIAIGIILSLTVAVGAFFLRQNKSDISQKQESSDVRQINDNQQTLSKDQKSEQSQPMDPENQPNFSAPMDNPPTKVPVQPNTKNSKAIDTRSGYDNAIKLIEKGGSYELRDMIFTKYLSEPEKGDTLILYTFYLEKGNREVQVKYNFTKKKASIVVEYDLDKLKEPRLSRSLGRSKVPEEAIDYGFERAIARIETNEDYLKIPNKTSNFPWMSFQEGPAGWEFQTMIDAKGGANKKEQYSFTVNFGKDQVFYEKRS